jgi:two-component system cell cycle response regulator
LGRTATIMNSHSSEPLAPALPSAPETPSQVSSESSSGGRAPARVVVAEDDFEISTLITLTLKMEGYEVLLARDGAAALKVVRESQPDLVLLDVMMPQMSGYDVARALQGDAQTVAIPIIFVTAKQEMEDRVLGLGLAVDYIGKPFVVPELLARVRAALRMRRLQEELRLSNERLSLLAVTDDLTGLANRRGFDNELEDEILRARRFGQPMAVAVFDLDRFKAINDTWGHQHGDIVLQAFARVLQGSSRRVDKTARIGGEEFVALLPTTDASGASIFAAKVRENTEAMEIPVDGEENGLRVTVSAGVAVLSARGACERENAELARSILRIADECLYLAKSSGRNRVVMREIHSWDELPIFSPELPELPE